MKYPQAGSLCHQFFSFEADLSPLKPFYTDSRVLRKYHVGQPPSAVHPSFSRRRGRLRYILIKIPASETFAEVSIRNQTVIFRRGESCIRPKLEGEHKIRPYNLMPFGCELVLADVSTWYKGVKGGYPVGLFPSFVGRARPAFFSGRPAGRTRHLQKPRGGMAPPLTY